MLRQTMVDSCCCLDRFVPEGISQVSRRSEVGNTKRRSLHTRLSSGTSAGTFAVSAGERWGAGVETQKNVRGEVGGWGRLPFNEPYAPSLSTIYDGA